MHRIWISIIGMVDSVDTYTDDASKHDIICKNVFGCYQFALPYLEINFCLLISGHDGVCMPAIRLKFNSFNIYCFIYMYMVQTNGTTNKHKIPNQSECSVNTQTGRKTISILHITCKRCMSL